MPKGEPRPNADNSREEAKRPPNGREKSDSRGGGLLWGVQPVGCRVVSIRKGENLWDASILNGPYSCSALGRRPVCCVGYALGCQWPPPVVWLSWAYRLDLLHPRFPVWGQ